MDGPARGRRRRRGQRARDLAGRDRRGGRRGVNAGGNHSSSDRGRFQASRGGRGGSSQGFRGYGPGSLYDDGARESSGESCWISHDIAAESTSSPPASAATASTGSSASSAAPQASSDVVNFTRRIEQAVARCTSLLSLDDSHDRGLWMQAWAAVAAGARMPSASALFRVLMRLPASAALTPPPLDVLRAALTILSIPLPASNWKKAGLLDISELIVDAVERRLLPRHAHVPRKQRAACANATRKLRSAAHAALLKCITEASQTERAARLLARAIGMFDRYEREMERTGGGPDADGSDGPESDVVEAQWTGWRDPTLGWLQHGKWLDAPELKNEYENIEEYAETLRKLVTMLTFYWGAGAIFPKCRQRGRDDQSCDQPLVAFSANLRQKPCGRRLPDGGVCARLFRWRCSRPRHDVACDHCLRRAQRALLGEPGPRASTDVYDAVVERETVRREGAVYLLSELSSRRPPRVGPNWKTTYRLKCSALIAVVRLNASCEPLHSSCTLEWAEVVPVSPQGGSTTDFVERSMGRIAIRFLHRQDMSTLSRQPQSLETGSRVAIIDLQVFVPEVLSVLSTVTDPALVEHLNHLPFAAQLTGASPSAFSVSLSGTVKDQVAITIDNSEIDTISRLPANRKAGLCRELTNLALKYNLYGSQLDAFCTALGTSLHCTQGPPGTGKSYVGVVLIHALNIIRRYAAEHGNAVGPIVVLSYKNHALDEILLDVLKGEGQRSGIDKGLIRCGKSDSHLLARFSERQSFEERRAQDNLSRRVSCLRNAQRIARDWRSLRNAMSLCGTEEEAADILMTWRPFRSVKVSDAKFDITEFVLEVLRFHIQVESLEQEPEPKAAYSMLYCLSMEAGEYTDKDESRILAVTSSLRDGTEHWLESETTRVAFLLKNWLYGKFPPPRCAASKEEGGCMLAVGREGAYCSELHNCQHPLQCSRRRVTGLMMCMNHRCTVSTLLKPCLLPRLDNSSVCAVHACLYCIRTHRVPIEPKDGDACKEHTCTAEGCSKAYVVAQLPFCADHCCSLCRHVFFQEPSVIKIGSIKRCKRSEFCVDHCCTVDDCSQFRLQSNYPQDYCAQHACRACKGSRKRVDPLVPLSGLCLEHHCEFTGPDGGIRCPSLRFRDSPFCDMHFCKICFGEGLPLDAVVVEPPPRNVCILHPLCAKLTADGKHCNDRTCSAASQYCERHAMVLSAPGSQAGDVPATCCGITSKGKPCKTKGRTQMNVDFYCPPHANQRDTSTSESEFTDEESEKSSAESEDAFEETRRHDDSIIVREPYACQTEDLWSASSRSEEMVCSGMTTKRKPCKARGFATAKSVFFCDAHENQRSLGKNDAGNESLNISYDTSSKRTVDDSVVALKRSELMKESSYSTDMTEPSSSASTHTSFALVERHGSTGDAFDSAKTHPQHDFSNVNHSDERQKDSQGSVSPSYLGTDRDTSIDETVAACVPEANNGVGGGDNLDEGGARAPPFSLVGHEMPGVSDEDTAEGTKERIAFGMCPDELDDASEDSIGSSADEVPAELERLREMIGRESTSGSDSDDVLEGDVVENAHSGDYSVNVYDWCWSQSRAERWSGVVGLLDKASASLSRLAVLAEGHVDCARQERAEAAAYSFKRATLIGATVVGATRRLHALRASEPFAMIVEEACEVLEPTLVSVLAVHSLRKLELIGDHRQLPAFVQQCWFAIQTTHPSIKVSLFERLVEGSSSVSGVRDGPTCTILDEQRRMRPEICDLTRCEYADTVQIVDHDCTVSQRVGDRSLLKTWSRDGEAWCEDGTAVPGVVPQVFFWNVKSVEGRASAGLSRCNHVEAEACVGLVGWLLSCGVPADGITIITPYKGQKMTIMKLLRKKVPGSVETPREGYFPPGGVIVSTVDRYQGDENDIVILSLVSTRPGNRFVALRNRFIVASSRARIGFYVIGMSEAVSKGVQGRQAPNHWLRFLRDLSPELRQLQGAGSTEVQKESRLGSMLSITCPRHQEITVDVSQADQFPSTPESIASFCSRICLYKLPWCGHTCGLSCHSPQTNPHTSNCLVCVPRPCDVHSDVPLRCCDVGRQGAWGGKSLALALESFECAIECSYRRPECPHTVTLPCTRHKRLLAGEFGLDACGEVVEDFAHPACGHVRKAPTCHLRREWEKEPPPCRKLVYVDRVCGCHARMTCEESIREASLDDPPLCLEAVSKPRPRCSHVLSCRCHEASCLRELWAEQDGLGVSASLAPIVYGELYGPSESRLGTLYPRRFDKAFPDCQMMTKYQASCGHVSEVLCFKAFELATGSRPESRCQQKTSFRSPVCGHEVSAPCHLRNACKPLSSSMWVERVEPGTANIEMLADERALELAPQVDSLLRKTSGLCNLSVSIVRKCTHKTVNVPCSSLVALLDSKQLPECEDMVSVARSCGHVYNVACHRQGDAAPVCNEPVDKVYTFPCGHEVRSGTCHLHEELCALSHPKCPELVRCKRYRCLHEVDVPCYLREKVTSVQAGCRLVASSNPHVVEADVDYCDGAVGVTDCSVFVVYRRSCGHEEMDVPCSVAFAWACGSKIPPPCQKIVDAESPLCGHLVSLPCNMEDTVVEADPWGGEPPERVTHRYDADVLTCPVISDVGRLPERPSGVIRGLMECGRTSCLQRSCGHEEQVPCHTVFDALESVCRHAEVVMCESCGAESSVECHEAKEIATSRLCKNRRDRVCSTCNVNVVSVACVKEVAQCDREVRTKMPCGHIAAWTCGEDDDPRVKLDLEPCLECALKDWLAAKEFTVPLSGRLTAEAASTRDKRGTQLAGAAENRMNAKQSDPFGTLVSPGFTYDSVVACLRSRALAEIPESWIDKQEEMRPLPANVLLEAYLLMLCRQIDLLNQAVANESREGVTGRPPPDVADANGAYDLVYQTLTKRDAARNSFKAVDTRYGFGTQCTALSLESLTADCKKHSRDGVLTVCVAAALRYQMAENVPPFCTDPAKRRKPDRKSRNKGKGKGGGDVVNVQGKKAGRLVTQFLERGFDSVSLASIDEPFQRVYWLPGALVPLVVLELKLQERCKICMDDVLPSTGWKCAHGHLLCYDCFDHHLAQAEQPDALARTVDKNGKLLCPDDECNAAYETAQLVQQKHEMSADNVQALSRRLEQLRVAAQTKREVSAALHHQKKRLEEEFRRIQQIKDLDERQAETIRLEIVEDILTLRCPQKECRMAFVDFEGCFALTCASCCASFCAWCVTYQSGDAHRHVASCPERSENGLFHDFAVFEKHHRERRGRLIAGRLREESGEVRRRVLRRLEKELADLRIVIG